MPMMIAPIWLMPMLAACANNGPSSAVESPSVPRVFRLAYSHSVHGEIEPCG